MNKTGDMEVAPLRSLDDFLLESARFQVPDLKDLEKWGKRVTSNLLYYQSNYFLMSIIIFIIVGILHPIKMIMGFLLMFLIISIFFYITNERGAASHFKKNHPIISVLILLSGGYFLTYMMGSVLVFFIGILAPISATFIHASLRLRNIKNKIANRVETLGFRQTPMGIFLEEMGLEQERVSKGGFNQVFGKK